MHQITRCWSDCSHAQADLQADVHIWNKQVLSWLDSVLSSFSGENTDECIVIGLFYETSAWITENSYE